MANPDDQSLHDLIAANRELTLALRDVSRAHLDLKWELSHVWAHMNRLENELQRRHGVIVEMLCTPGGAQAYFSQAVPFPMPGLDAMFKKSRQPEPYTDTGSVDPEADPPLPQ